jgi:DNA transformation protein
VMIGLISRGVIYLKADATTIPEFEREGLGPFTYRTSTGQRSLASYWRMPDRLYDAPDELVYWARRAHAAALLAGEVAGRPKAKRQAKRPAKLGPRKKK